MSFCVLDINAILRATLSIIWSPFHLPFIEAQIFSKTIVTETAPSEAK